MRRRQAFDLETGVRRVDGHFGFLSAAQTELLGQILARRNPGLFDRVQDFVSHADAEDIMAVIGDEFTNHLDDDWEPTEHGKVVGALLAKFNAAVIGEWP